MTNTDYKTVSKLLFPDENESNKKASEKFSDLIREQAYALKRKHFQQPEPEESLELKNCREIADFMKKHVASAGKEQAVQDFQTGLNLLNGYKNESPVEAKVKLEEDSEFGEKTFAALFNVLKNYPVSTVERYVRLGAINNKIWSTKNDTSIDTDSEVERLTGIMEVKDE